MQTPRSFAPTRWSVAALTAMLGAPLALAQSFEGLGDLPGGSFESHAHGVSADGSTVVGVSIDATGSLAVRWRAGALTPLPDVAGGPQASQAIACNFDGSVIVGSGRNASTFVALRWDDTTLSVLPKPPGFPGGHTATGISANGSTTAGYGTDADLASYSNVCAYRIDDGTITSMPFTGSGHVDSATQGSPSDDGGIVAGRIMTAAGVYQACAWIGSTLTPLAKLAGGTNYSHGYGVSGDGAVVVGVSGSSAAGGSGFNGEACRWLNMVPAGLGDLPGGTYNGIAWSCNRDGSVIVGQSESANGTRAFYWTAAQGMRELASVLSTDFGLNVTGWRLEVARAITPDGSTIVGTGINPAGAREGWIARLDCPDAWSYCTAGTTTNGCTPHLTATGHASATSNSGFTLVASAVEGQKQGLFFYGTSGAQATPWGTSSSVLCVRSPTQRMPSSSSGGTSNACNGTLSIDWNAFRAANPGAVGTPFIGGETLYVQAWFRDPPSPKTTSLTDALSTLVCP